LRDSALFFFLPRSLFLSLRFDRYSRPTSQSKLALCVLQMIVFPSVIATLLLPFSFLLFLFVCAVKCGLLLWAIVSSIPSPFPFPVCRGLLNPKKESLPRHRAGFCPPLCLDSWVCQTGLDSLCTLLSVCL
jgi:hypothetical protein